jgi:CO/xanthine dehydrogenase Mo-binding subunit
VLAAAEVRHRGEPVLALVGEADAVASVRDEELPIAWEPLAPVVGVEAALAPGAPVIHAFRPDNVLARGRVVRGDAEAALGSSAATAEVAVETGFVEHAYIEPEAGYAVRVGDRVEVFGTTQAPYMDRDEVAAVLGVAVEQVRIVPSACGGGFGGKLDALFQPILAVAAWVTGLPCPHGLDAAGEHGRLHQAPPGPHLDGGRRRTRTAGSPGSRSTATSTPVPTPRGARPWRPASRSTRPAPTPSGPPAARPGRLHERHARGCLPRLRGSAERHRPRSGDGRARRPAGDGPARVPPPERAPSGRRHPLRQRLEDSAGLPECLEALRPHWRRQREAAAAFNARGGHLRRGVGVGCMWYGLGNTAMANPSAMEVGLAADGTLTLYNGAVDIGQGSGTIMVQICAEALGLPVAAFRQVLGDTDLTLDAGKTSASRQTFVSGNAARLAGLDLRRQILRLANAGEDATLALDGPIVRVSEAGRTAALDLRRLDPAGGGGDVLRGRGEWDPPTRALDEDGQGVPYASYGFAAQVALVEVDEDLGTTRVLRMWAAHDVGRAVNPTLVEGQIHGGIAQGLGLALMEEFVPGRGENLHDYLIPTVGDVPEIEVFLIDGGERLGPYGAKGVGEPALVATAPAILARSTTPWACARRGCR